VRRVFLLGVLLLALPARAQTSLHLGLVAVAEMNPAYVAVDQGFFAKHGFSPTLQIVPNSATLIPAMLHGDVDVGGPPAAVFLSAAAQGLPLVCFAATSWIDPKDPVGAVIARDGVTIARAEDLVGKRVAVSGINSVMQVLLRYWLDQRHVDSAKISFVEVPFSRMGDSLRAGAVDAAVAVAPFTLRMEQSGVGHLALDYYRDLPNGTLSSAYCSTKDWVAAHPDAVTRFRAALDDAKAFILAHPTEARAILAKTLKLDAAVAGSLPMGTMDFGISASQIGWWDDVMQAQGLLDHRVDPASVLVP
jgi:NitT/TauT family transport system substrate-binding protein